MELKDDSLRLRLADLPPDLLLKISAASTLPVDPLLDYKLLTLKAPCTRDPPALEGHLRTYRFLFALGSRLHTDLSYKASYALAETRLHGLGQGHKHKRCYTCGYGGALAGTPSRADWLGVYEIYIVLAIQLAGFLPRVRQRELIAKGVTKINFPGEWKQHPEVLNPPERAMVNIRASLLSVRHLLDAETDEEVIEEIDDFSGYVRKLVESKQGGHSGQSVHRLPLPENFDSLVFHGQPSQSRRQELDEIFRLIRTNLPAEQVAKRCEAVIGREPNELEGGTYLVKRIIDSMKGLSREVALLANTLS